MLSDADRLAISKDGFDDPGMRDGDHF